jgi:2-phosphosulfolactate phosphatase
MRIDVSLIPAEFDGKVRGADRVVVIDVLRASSSIITALDRGASCLIPAFSSEEAIKIGRRQNDKNILFCGEKDGLKIKGFDLGNSPEEYTSDRVAGKTLIFVSTNGAPMMVKSVREKKSFWIAGFLNIRAVAERIVNAGGNCLLACSGLEGRFSLEDAVCAGMLTHEIQKQSDHAPVMTDEAHSSFLLFRHHADDLQGMAKGSRHGVYLKGIGLARDIPACVAVNQVETVPVFRNGALRLN